MKVNIRYSIELDKVLDLIKEKLNESLRLSTEVTAEIATAQVTLSDNLLEASKRLNSVQIMIDGLGADVSDSLGIMLGYQKALIEQEQPPPPEENSQVPDGLTSDEGLGEHDENR